MAGRIIGIDYGKRRIGMATTDPRQVMALPYKTLEAKKELKDTLALLEKELKALAPVEKIVIGLPLEMSGKSGSMAEEVKVFGEALHTLTSTPIIYWDERLTSAQVEKNLKSFDYNRKQRSVLSDTAAACLILESYLMYQNRSSAYEG